MNILTALLATHKVALGIAVAVLASGAAVGTFAAQDKLPGQAHGVILASLDASPTATSQVGATNTPAPPSTPTPGEVHGIPTTNPAHDMAETPGACERGDTAVKTTPAGVQVNVPCQAIHNAETPEADKTPGPDEHNSKTVEPAEVAEATSQPEPTEQPHAHATPGAHGESEAHKP